MFNKQTRRSFLAGGMAAVGTPWIVGSANPAAQAAVVSAGECVYDRKGGPKLKRSCCAYSFNRILPRGKKPGKMTMEDFVGGLFKTFFFGWIIAMVGCFAALQTEGGTVGVGRATTRSVVLASIGVLVANFFLTQILVML